MSIRRLNRALLGMVACCVPAGVRAQDAALPPLQEIRVASSVDGTDQPVRLYVPPKARTETTPMLVFLHSWSGDYKQANTKWLQRAVNREWIYLHPNFRGRNDSPQACGSRWARQDVLDAMDFVCRRYQVDSSRVYLAGVSGGGHMAMQMAAWHADRFSAASAWVGISDLAAWYRFHLDDQGRPTRYAQMIAACCGGAPGESSKVDAAYRERSPLFHIHQVGDLPIEICTGVDDGHTGSVPVGQSLLAFNAIAKAHGTAPITTAEIQQLSQQRRLLTPLPSDTVRDPAWSRGILLRLRSGPARVTVFQGGHESLPDAAFAWLEAHRRMAQGCQDKAGR